VNPTSFDDPPDALDDLPALAASKGHLRSAIADRLPADELAAVVQDDPALTLAVLRAANRAPNGWSTATVRDGVRALAATSLAEVAETLPTFDFFADRQQAATSDLERFRVHALSVRRLAATVARLGGRGDVEVAATAGLLHDVGKLAFAGQQRRGPSFGPELTPEQRVLEERERSGTDHAQVGGQLARRWRLPDVLMTAIASHHDEHPTGVAALVTVADLLAHFAAGARIDLYRLAAVGQAAGLDRGQLGSLLYELPAPLRATPPEPCPLSARELEIVRELRDGKVGKQIARDLNLSESTVRSHLQRIYRRLGVADRAQAVLLASSKGWI
jgi:putative nucleotidyltransferase with HDIG domain